METKQWLLLDDDTLGTELAKALVDGPWEHDLEEGFWDGEGTMSRSYRCRKCKLLVSDMVEGKNTECSVPNRIDITSWDTAMEYKGANTQIHKHLYTIYYDSNTGISNATKFARWLTNAAQPKHYLIAAAMAKEAQG